jgi:cysteine sulfinate desulfinase/cysteine desulfurase-like protein
MALPDQRAHSAVRLSVGRWTTSDDIAQAANQLADAAANLHHNAPADIEQV